ncbi:hypothetical protein ITI46_23390 [Streptomyces oryzae]|uniref:Uncharacterized protein n=2 Tax=Streptomyces oryzae TaxID=1434886 RepID=A0ABS3XGS6_9ACTN|nr:hypothetical protein [Streptomyces oryzae]
MHTLGHPTPERAAPAVAEHVSADPGTGHHMTQEHHVPAPQDGHGMGTDPLSLCLAVLGVWTAAALLGAAVLLVRRRLGAGLWAAGRARVPRVLWPLPPPRTASRLAQLSILRT